MNALPSPTRGKSPSWWFGHAILLAALWLSLIRLPGAPVVGLDSSWQMVMSFAAKHDLQQGRDIVFTYGPLGYLLTSTFMGDHFGLVIGWQLLGNLCIAAALWRFGLESRGWRQALYYGYLLLYGTLYTDAMQMNFIAIFALLLMRPAFRRPGWLAGVGAALAIFGLMKFTNLLLGAFCLVVLVGYFLRTGAARAAAWLGGAFAATFLILWLAHGQHLGNLPAFFLNGLQVSLGYVEAMGVAETPTMLALGLGALVAIAGYGLLYLGTQPDRRIALATVLMLGAVIFINWKHGFVRADGHMLAHFLMCLGVAGTYPSLTHDQGGFPRAKQAVLLVAALCSFTGMGLMASETVGGVVGAWNRRVLQNGRTLLALGEYHRSLNGAIRALALRLDHPNLRHMIGAATVDHLGADQIYTLLNHLNYTPRPAVQSYTTYTERLNRLDEEFFLSSRAPRYVIQRFQSIDGRLPTLDDSLALKLILQTHNYLTEEGGLLLWERPSPLVVPGPETEKTLLHRTVRFGEAVDVPDTGDRPVWAQIRIHRSFLGGLRNFFYKPPPLRLRVTDQAGKTQPFLLIRAIAATGFLLNPLVTEGADLLAFEHGTFSRRMTKFQVETDGPACFADEIDVELHSLAPFPQGASDVNRRLANRFAMMNRKPVAVESIAPMASVMLDGREVLMLHARGRMEFAADPALRTVRGRFGILPGASGDSDHATDGVEFVIELQPATGAPIVLFRQFLNPQNQPADRGMKEFAIELPARVAGRLVFHTLPGPNNNQSFDWAYWTDLEFK